MRQPSQELNCATELTVEKHKLSLRATAWTCLFLKLNDIETKYSVKHKMSR